MKPDVIAVDAPLSIAERRRFPRYRYSAPIVVHIPGAPDVPGMSVEISECGMSAVIGASLKVGDTINLEPVGGGPSSAVIRRSLGRLYGFEFQHLTLEQTEKIRAICKMLPMYRSKTLDLWQK